MRIRDSVLLVLALSLVINTGMARRGQYDEEAREVEKMNKDLAKEGGYSAARPVSDMASGVKQATYDSTKEFLSEAKDGTTDNPPVVGTVKGVVDGSGKVLENTSKGVAKVVTLGRADTSTFRVEEPEHKNEDDTTKVKFNF